MWYLHQTFVFQSPTKCIDVDNGSTSADEDQKPQQKRKNVATSSRSVIQIADDENSNDYDVEGTNRRKVESAGAQLSKAMV